MDKKSNWQVEPSKKFIDNWPSQTFGAKASSTPPKAPEKVEVNKWMRASTPPPPKKDSEKKV